METPIYLTRAQSRAVDEIAIREYGMLGLVLMENAGRNCAEVILKHLENHPEVKNWPLLICCGKGNNGGDGFVIARHLANKGIESTVLLWADAHELTGDAAANFAILKNMNASIAALADSSWNGVLGSIRPHQVIVIDALLGTGAMGEPRAPYDRAIAWINSLDGVVFAIDLPSGLDADSGAPSSQTVRAGYTLTFVTQKLGFLAAEAKPFLGQVQVIDIGAPRQVIAKAAALASVPYVRSGRPEF
jgi:NAD(P)H-hydrate epimerase